MTTIILVVAVLAVAGGITYFLMKGGKIADANNNNIPDAIEEKIEKVEEAVEVVKATAKKVKKVAEKVAETTEKVVKPAAKRGRKPAQK